MAHGMLPVDIEELDKRDSMLERMRKTGRNLGVHGVGAGMRMPIGKVIASTAMPTDELAASVGMPYKVAATPERALTRDLITRLAAISNMLVGNPAGFAQHPGVQRVIRQHPMSPQNLANRAYNTGLKGPEMTDVEWNYLRAPGMLR